MLERLRTIAVVSVMTAILAYITLGAMLVYFEGTGAWTRLINSGWCPQSICKIDRWQN